MNKQIDSRALRELLEAKQLLESSRGEAVFDGIFSDSRQLEQVSGQKLLFFARRGLSRDGHDFLRELASEQRIAGYVVEEKAEEIPAEKSLFVVRDSHQAMGFASKIIYGDPTLDLLSVAITGTNGKTTLSYLCEAILKKSGARPAVMGTIESRFEDDRQVSALTTPDFSILQKRFCEWKEKGASAIVFEASSHAIQQKRLFGIELDAALFTNLSPEHLDYHKTMEAYFRAKKRLFSEHLLRSQKKRRRAIIPQDGKYGSRLIEDLRDSDLEIWSWGFEAATAQNYFEIRDWKTTLDGSRFQLCSPSESLDIYSPLVGRHNIENLASAACFGLSLGVSADDIVSAFRSVRSIPGRLEKVPTKLSGSVFVDYAHTPDALENVLQSLRTVCQGRLKVVFGCGGDRDRAKRPQMGQVAELYADEIYVTSDNPRSEDPHAIMDEILKGMQRIKPVEVEADRRKAIGSCLSKTEMNDVVLIAGKGHETTQEIQGKKIHFDDREVVRAYAGAKA